MYARRGTSLNSRGWVWKLAAALAVVLLFAAACGDDAEQAAPDTSAADAAAEAAEAAAAAAQADADAAAAEAQAAAAKAAEAAAALEAAMADAEEAVDPEVVAELEGQLQEAQAEAAAAQAAAADAAAAAEAAAAAVAELEAAAAAAAVEPAEAITWAISDEPVAMDPPFNYDYNTATIGGQICEGLLRIDKDNQLRPNLATDWKRVDDLTYRYTLRPDVMFHDGTIMTAEDVKFSLDRHRDPDVGSYLIGFHERVDSVEITGDLEITVTLNAPDVLWEYAVATQAAHVVSQAFVEANADETGGVHSPDAGIVCTGPYGVESWTPGQGVELVAFSDYWGGAPDIEAISIRVLTDPATIIAGLNSGEIDGTLALDGRQALSLHDSVTVETADSVAAAFIAFNTTRAPFDDVRVRQALALVLDRAGIASTVYGGLAQPLAVPAPPILWTYAADEWSAAFDALPSYDRDVERARQLVEEAGAVGAGADLMVSTSIDEEVGIIVQAAAAEIGLEISLVQIPYAEKTGLEYADGPKDYDMTLLSWGSDFPDPIGNMYFPFTSVNVITNVAAYVNPDVDRLLEEARGTTDDDERARLLIEVQQIVVDELPWAVYVSPDVVLSVNDLRGYSPNGFWYFTSWSDELER
jgi:peptide/nickel transport system substrate-binding protein